VFIARGDRVIVKPENQQEYEHSGLYVVDHYAPDVMGTVIACGPGDVKVDDVVLFPPTAGQVLEHGGERYLVLREDELIAVVE
jgi:chaperonin GroES